ncbi:MAG TPA: ABC transporter permease, partial [Planctomycetaceae bacterium]|nr:ABC transporter permease [Planctomycetaceae bacterium]
MTHNSLLLRSLTFAWRTNLAIILGVAVGAAVIGGALIVGDSVRASLRKMTLDRLGEVDAVVTGPRFFTQKLSDSTQTAPAIIMVAGVQRKAESITRRAGQVNVYGIEAGGWKLLYGTPDQLPRDRQAVINQSLAEALGADVGQEITIWIELPSAVPRDTLLGKRDNDAQEVTVTVSAILPDGPGAARFGLNPTQQLPMNLFVALDTLQDALDLAELKPTRRDPVGAPARVNSLLLGDSSSTDAITENLRRQWTLADLNLRLVHDPALNAVSVESEQMLLDTRFAEAAQTAAEKLGVPSSPVMVYLANWIRNPNDAKAYSMYSTVAGLDVLSMPDRFGPFEFIGDKPSELKNGEVILNEFLAEDLKVRGGDTIRYGYHLVGSQGELPEEERTAVVRGIVKMTGPAVDRNLTPHVKGVTDADSLDEWDQPFPMKLDEVTPRDDEYWDSYRATPKAFFRLEEAQSLWRSRYGSLTSVRIAIPEGKTFEQTRDDVARLVLEQLTPAEVGLAFQSVKAIGLQAASGANDFSVLFLGFSFFLILSAMILVGLLFRLAIEQRVRQLGLLGAVGWSPSRIRGLMLGEGAVLVTAGSLLGGLFAVGYAEAMIYGLKTWWIGAIGTKFLIVDVQPLAVIIGVLAAAITSFAAILWGLWQLRTVSLRERLVGVSEVEVTDANTSKASLFAAISGGIAAVLILASIAGLIPAQQAFSGFSWSVVSFFLAGMLFLASGLWAFSAWLQVGKQSGVRGRGLAGIIRLGGRNAARRKQRSVLTTGLIASATFVVAAVAAAHKNPAVEAPDKASGNGGFTLVAESSSPILYDLNTAEGRSKV